MDEMTVPNKVAEVRRRLDAEVRAVGELENLRVEILGRKGWLASQIAGIPSLDATERPAAGKALNEAKRQFTALFDEAAARLSRQKPESRVRPDPTLPGIRPPRGHVHPVSRTIDEITDIFARLGFEAVEGPEVELDWYNFEALNIPPDHPARDAWDTFYITEQTLLRPHTSPGQIRAMERMQPPLRIIVPGRCFRRDTEDARHFSMFHQVEGLMVGEGVNFGDLKAALHMFLRMFFRADVAVRFRPSFFPFTEPSAEVDCSCVVCRGAGCQTCSYSGWLEVLGAGMVNPNVFQAVGYDPERYTGFAFGMGVDRLAMLLHGIPDGRALFQNDMRFLSQF